MTNTESYPEIARDDKPFLSLVKIVGAILIAFSFTFLIFFIFFKDLLLKMGSSTVEELKAFKIEILIVQGIYTVGLFILSSLLYLFLYERKPLSSLNVPNRLHLIPVLLTFLLVIIFMPINSWFIDWNQNVDLPDFWGFEQWAKEKELSNAALTKLISDIRSPLEFILSFSVIAILAAIGEELLFRGLIQSKLTAVFKNPHVAIIVASAIFSAFHIQFYGFVPRMLLGMLFGYLYHWSKNISIPIFAHFVNNGFTVIAMYMYTNKHIDYNMEEATKAPFATAVSSAIVTAGILFSFWKYYTGKKLLQ